MTLNVKPHSRTDVELRPEIKLVARRRQDAVSLVSNATALVDLVGFGHISRSALGMWTVLSHLILACTHTKLWYGTMLPTIENLQVGVAVR